MSTSTCAFTAVGIPFILLGPFEGLPTGASKPGVIIPPILKSGEGFSFRRAELIKATDDTSNFSLDLDLVWDPPNGLAANHVENRRPFSGKGGIIDTRKKSLRDVKVPSPGPYEHYIGPKEIKIGHVYCLRTADGRRYAKLLVIEYDQKRERLAFVWDMFD
jgi:hypothetical protein